jgi:hypothetical protein
MPFFKKVKIWRFCPLIFVKPRVFQSLATCSLQFAEAGSAATLPQQKKNNSADAQRKKVNITGLCAKWQGNSSGDVSSASSARQQNRWCRPRH